MIVLPLLLTVLPAWTQDPARLIEGIEPVEAASAAVVLHQAQAAAFREAAKHVAPSVVRIETVGGTQPVEAGGQPGRPRFIVADGPTTGLVYSTDGLILASTFNFVREPVSITVILADGRRFVAELLARDEVRRLAMLKIAAADLPVPGWVESSADIRVGQWALALGRGFGGPDGSLGVGIVSGLNRMSGLAIQTDARLSPANFGGPLIDIRGRVLGLCVPLGLDDAPIAGVEWYDSGIGFAIPYAQVSRSATDLAVGHTLRRGMFGVELDAQPGRPPRIIGLRDPSPAKRADLRPGDEIIAAADQPVASFADLRRILRGHTAGQWVPLRLRREGAEMTREVILAVPEDIGPPAATAPAEDPSTR